MGWGVWGTIYIYREREIERETNSKLVTQNSETQIVSQTFKRSLSATAKFAVISIFQKCSKPNLGFDLCYFSFLW